MLPKINPTQTEAWKALNTHFAQNDFELRSLFQYNPERFNQFSVQREEYLFDYSKNLIDAKTSKQINDTIIENSNDRFKPSKAGEEHYLKNYYYITTY